MNLTDIQRLAISPALALLPGAVRVSRSVLYPNPCPDCGKARLSDKRRLGTPCMACANKRRSTHGLTGHRLYWVLQGMIARCESKLATHYAYYGGRGIKVCDRWRKDPAAFVSWAEAHGYQPGLEIDRKDNDGPYSPENCQFLPHLGNSQKRGNARCDQARAKAVKDALGAGWSIKAAAAANGVPYMVAWHISKGNTWRNA